jgi:hypothetical protein
MTVSEDKIRQAFAYVKGDIIALQREIAQLRKDLHTKRTAKVPQPVVKKVLKKVAKKSSSLKKKEIFIASKLGKKFFSPDSISAQKIKKENQIVFKTRDAALKAGYKPARA